MLYGNAAGDGQPCGESFIAGDKVCRIGSAPEDSEATAAQLKAAGIDNLRSGNCWVFAATQWQKLKDAGKNPVILNWGGHVEAALARPGGGYTAYTTEGPRPAENLGIPALRAATRGKPLKVHATAQAMLDDVKVGALTGYWYGDKLKPHFDKAAKVLDAKWNTEPDPRMANAADNCGTGTGGFRPGNTCAAGGGSGAGSQRKIAFGFTSPEARTLFSKEWKRWTGSELRPERKNGENYGFHLKDSDDLRIAGEIEKAHPGTILGWDLIMKHVANADDDAGEFLSKPLPFKEAVKYVTDKHLLPTTLSSEQLMALDPAVRERAMFSARTANAWYLQRIKDVTDLAVNPESAGGKAWVGRNAGSARAQLKDALRSIGYAPAPGDKGTIKDLSSDQRLNLIVRTQIDMAHGFGQRAQQMTDDAIEQYPAWEFYRAEDRNEPRDWPARWEQAGGEFYEGDADYPEGRMISLKLSPIWEEISAFGVPHAPFDYNSGCDLKPIDREECIELGLIDEGWTPEGEQDALDPDDFAAEGEASAEQFDDDVAEALAQSMGAGYGIVGGVLKLVGDLLGNEEARQRANAEPNCGTGAGGFQPGNRCAAGGGDRTATPEFKAWFGESKVVDNDGKPLRVYHGGDSNISVFGSVGSNDPQANGFYFSQTGETASQYAEAREERTGSSGVIYPVFLSIQNPFIHSQLNGFKTNKELVVLAKAGGHDGVVIRDTYDRVKSSRDDVPETVFIAFHPTQIKSAIGNNGSWSKSNPSITNEKISLSEARRRALAVIEKREKERARIVEEEYRRSEGTWSNTDAEAAALLANILNETKLALCAN